MDKRKRIEQATPVSTDPRLQELEDLRRREIARRKETDMEGGRKESLSVSAIMSELDAEVLRGAKMVSGGRKGHEGTHGTQAEKVARWTRIAQTYTDLKRAHPEWKEKQLDAETATLCGVSVRTAQEFKRYGANL